MKILPSKKIIICTKPSNEISSGIIVSASENDKEPELGIVYAIGEGNLPLDVKIGDVIVFRRYTDNKILIETEEFNFISFKDIVGVVKKDKK